MTRVDDNEPDVEILVHITAPSLAVDDANYRHLASAYVNFEEASITHLNDSPPTASTPIRIRTPVFATLESPPLSFEDVIDNVGSPDMKLQAREKQDGRGEKHAEVTRSESQDSWEAPPSTVGDSQPYNDLRFERFCDPDRVIEYQFDKLDRSVSEPVAATLPGLAPGSNKQMQSLDGSLSPIRALSSQIAPAHGHAIVSSSPQRRRISLNVHSSLPTAPRRSQRLASSSRVSAAASPSLIEQTVFSSPCITSSPPIPGRLLSRAPESTAAVQSSPRQGQEIIEVPSSPPISFPRHAKDPDVSFGSVITCSDRSESEPPPAKRTRRAPREATHLNERSVSHAKPPPRSNKPEQEALCEKLLSTLEVFGPEPPVSISHITPDDLLTPQLRKLKSDLGKAKRYYARVQLLQDQGPDPFERGWWTLNSSELGDRRMVAWEYLARYIDAGNAGWGVSLMRQSVSTDRIKLFCYGHLAGYMYLLLYMASERRTYDLDCTWTSAWRGNLLFVPAVRGR